MIEFVTVDQKENWKCKRSHSNNNNINNHCGPKNISNTIKSIYQVVDKFSNEKTNDCNPTVSKDTIQSFIVVRCIVCIDPKMRVRNENSFSKGLSQKRTEIKDKIDIFKQYNTKSRLSNKITTREWWEDRLPSNKQQESQIIS
jgi:hypothetical protein